jgi:hypothetical protein
VKWKPSLIKLADAPSTLGGLWLALGDQYEASAKTLTAGNIVVVLATNPTTVSLYMHGRNTTSFGTWDVYCVDPIDDMISMLQELTCRTALSPKEMTDPTTGNTRYPSGPETSVTSPNLTATNRTVQQQATVSMAFDETVYVVRYGWLLAAFILIALTCLAILPTYWGWWLLGRPVSLSPLEIAKAFDAPFLRRIDANGTSQELARAIGDVWVCYQSMPPCEDRLVGENYEMDLLCGGVSTHSPGADVRRRYGFRRMTTEYEIRYESTFIEQGRLAQLV